MKRTLVVFVTVVLCALAARAEAAHCIAWGMDNSTPPMPVCTEYGPDAPAGWTEVVNSYQPAPGEVKLCHKTSGYGVCIKRAFASGNTLVTNLGEFENGTYRVKSYWFNVAQQSTTFSQESLACPTCTTVASGLSGLNNNSSAYIIKAITVRN